ncbi:hypothetical protein BJV82DRAFT_674206 [Fennellomyces sp. T-0311]|nr:hypothetical protein BJV82DRAFT_674206 [Fennellomyces sp. T-0311]
MPMPNMPTPNMPTPNMPTPNMPTPNMPTPNMPMYQSLHLFTPHRPSLDTFTASTTPSQPPITSLHLLFPFVHQFIPYPLLRTTYKASSRGKFFSNLPSSHRLFGQFFPKSTYFLLYLGPQLC